MVKVRLQSKEHLGRYTSTLQCARAIVATEGAAALTTGLHATIWRNSVWNSVYFMLMATLRPRVAAATNAETNAVVRTASTLSVGFVCGTLATCFNNPFDVIKSRLQAELKAGSSRGDASVFGRLRDVWRAEGVRGLYAGFAAKALRMGLGGAVGMAAFEGAADVLARK